MGLTKSLKGKGPEHVVGESAENDQIYEAPPGPPPSQALNKYKATEDYAKSPGPPPSHTPTENPPPYHNWTSIPDTSLLPPPPALGHRGSKNNASWDDAARAHAYCDSFPPYTPVRPSAAVYGAVRGGDIVIEKPREFAGSLTQNIGGGRGAWTAKSHRDCGDCVLLSTLVRLQFKLARVCRLEFGS